MSKLCIFHRDFRPGPRTGEHRLFIGAACGLGAFKNLLQQKGCARAAADTQAVGLVHGPALGLLIRLRLQSRRTVRPGAVQKTAGQPEYAKAGDERFETSLDQLMNFIIIETMCLWLSGGLNKLKDMEDEQ